MWRLILRLNSNSTRCMGLQSYLTHESVAVAASKLEGRGPWGTNVKEENKANWIEGRSGVRSWQLQSPRLRPASVIKRWPGIQKPHKSRNWVVSPPLLGGCESRNYSKGHFTHETESPWPLHFKHSHWWKRRSRSNFASHYVWRTNGVCECKMDVKSTWIPTWHQMGRVSWSLQALSLVEKAEPVRVRFTLCLRDQRSMWMQDGRKVYMDSYMAPNGSCFMVTWIIFKNHLLEVGLTRNRETMVLWTFTTVGLFYFIMCEDPHE
jgi:hypothetical protein